MDKPVEIGETIAAYIEEATFAALVFEERGEGGTLEIQGGPHQLHCLVVDGGPTAYGAIAVAEVVGRRLILTIEPTSALTLGLPVYFAMTLSAEDARLVRDRLPGILYG